MFYRGPIVATILILDDDLLFCEALSTTLEDEGHRVLIAHNLLRARELLKKHTVAIIFIDVYLPDGNGLELLPGLSLLPETPEAIVVTAMGDPESAETAIKSGAWDYVQKPANMSDIVLMVERVLQEHERKTQMPDFTGTSGIIASSHPMKMTLLQMFEAAQSEVPVLISGETGTGKELVARAVHANSRRSGGPFVVVDCGAISPTLIESELFGHIRGAFTGAAQNRQGLVVLAEGGTLFLDEVGELALDQQKIFLRLLQERRFRRLGSTEEEESDFRVVAATNRNLVEMASCGTFRPDLLFRLQGVSVTIPPVSKRGDDIVLLAQHAVNRAVARYGLPEKVFSRDALQAITSYSWPGNVRELLNTVEAAALGAGDAQHILVQHLPIHLRAHAARSKIKDQREEEKLPDEKHDPAPLNPPEAPPHPHSALLSDHAGAALRPVTGPAAFPLASLPQRTTPPELLTSSGGNALNWKQFQETVLHGHKRDYLVDLLSRTRGNVPAAAKMAGVSRQRFYTLLREHNIARQWDLP